LNREKNACERFSKPPFIPDDDRYAAREELESLLSKTEEVEDELLLLESHR
jgi:hypothetical protein